MEIDIDWPPGPPSARERQFDDLVEMVLFELVHAARGNDLANRTSGAMASIERSIAGGERLACTRRRDDILQAVAMIHGRLRVGFSRWNHDETDEGISALALQIVFWGEAPIDRDRWDSDTVADMTALARRLRNDLHTACLKDQLADLRHGYRAGRIKQTTFVSLSRRFALRMEANELHNVRITSEVAARRRGPLLLTA